MELQTVLFKDTILSIHSQCLHNSSYTDLANTRLCTQFTLSTLHSSAPCLAGNHLQGLHQGDVAPQHASALGQFLLVH